MLIAPRAPHGEAGDADDEDERKRRQSRRAVDDERADRDHDQQRSSVERELSYRLLRYANSAIFRRRSSGICAITYSEASAT